MAYPDICTVDNQNESEIKGGQKKFIMEGKQHVEMPWGRKEQGWFELKVQDGWSTGKRGRRFKMNVKK